MLLALVSCRLFTFVLCIPKCIRADAEEENFRENESGGFKAFKMCSGGQNLHHKLEIVSKNTWVSLDILKLLLGMISINFREQDLCLRCLEKK